MSGNGKGGDNRNNRRRSSKRRERENSRNSKREAGKGAQQYSAQADNKKTADLLFGEKVEKKRGGLFERPRWTPPKLPAEALPLAECAWCGKTIKDMSSAISESDSGNPVHFDCVIARISKNEKLAPGDTVSYIGGGRFGIVRVNNSPDTKSFNIKKIFELENREHRSEWRQVFSDHFSVT